MFCGADSEKCPRNQSLTVFKRGERGILSTANPGYDCCDSKDKPMKSIKMFTNDHEWMPCVICEEIKSPGAKAQGCCRMRTTRSVE